MMKIRIIIVTIVLASLSYYVESQTKPLTGNDSTYIKEADNFRGFVLPIQGFNIKRIFTASGFLIQARRDKALLDVYISFKNCGIDIDLERTLYNFDSIEKSDTALVYQLNKLCDSLQIIKGGAIEILEYEDLRYGQMCSTIRPNKARFIGQYLIRKGVPSGIIASGFGYDEPYVIKKDDGVFKKADLITRNYIVNLKKESDKAKAYTLTRRVEVIVLPWSIIRDAFKSIPLTFALKDSTADSGSVCTLRDIHFSLFHYQKDIDSLSYPVVDSIVRFLKRNPTMKMGINAYLSPTTGQMCYMPHHARTIADYLIKQGIDSARVITREWGATKPIIPLNKILMMKTDKEKMAAYRLNQRIELRVLDPILK